jgi:hypothetical protein
MLDVATTIVKLATVGKGHRKTTSPENFLSLNKSQVADAHKCDIGLQAALLQGHCDKLLVPCF